MTTLYCETCGETFTKDITPYDTPEAECPVCGEYFDLEDNNHEEYDY